MLAQRRIAATSVEDRRRHGQFFTPPPIAEFMAGLTSSHRSDPVTLIDAGAGAGVLGVAAAAHILREGADKVHLIAVELERDTLEVLRESLELARNTLGERFSYEVRGDDFLDYSRQDCDRPAPVDLVISNPPYGKLSRQDPRGGGWTNSYARFMDIASQLLKPGGELVFIVPRSYASGHYFRRFRRSFHRCVALDQVHMIESRRAAFGEQGVLQETIILAGHRSSWPHADGSVQISTSLGTDDIGHHRPLTVPRRLVVDPCDENSWLVLPSSANDLSALRTVRALDSRIESCGLRVLTGPVVPFRAQSYLRMRAGSGSIPLLWMQHVRRGAVRWPIGKKLGKPEHLRPDTPSNRLIANQHCVLLRRFSAKEDRHRLISAPLARDTFPGNWLGVENHLNVVAGATTEMAWDMAVSLSAVLNSEIYERYFRVISGNTQVSAAEVRGTPFPAPTALTQAGVRLLAGEESTSVVKALLNGAD